MNEVLTHYIRFIFFFGIYFLPYSLFSQSSMAGIEFSHGSSQKTANGHSFISPFDQDFYSRRSIEIKYGLPLSSWFTISTGLEFIKRKGADNHFNNLAIPLYADFSLGNSLQFLIGPGLHLNYLVGFDVGSTKYHKAFEENKNVVQVSWQLHAGFAFKVASKTRIHFLYEQGFDLTPITNYAHTDIYQIFNERWYDGTISAGVMTSVFEK
jgi:hypothetical protein